MKVSIYTLENIKIIHKIHQINKLIYFSLTAYFFFFFSIFWKHINCIPYELLIFCLGDKNLHNPMYYIFIIIIDFNKERIFI